MFPLRENDSYQPSEINMRNTLLDRSADVLCLVAMFVLGLDVMIMSAQHGDVVLIGFCAGWHIPVGAVRKP